MFGIHKRNPEIVRREKSLKLSTEALNLAKNDLETYKESPRLTDLSRWGDMGLPAERVVDYEATIAYDRFAINTYTPEMFKDEQMHHAIIDIDAIVLSLESIVRALHYYEYYQLAMKNEQKAENPNAKKLKEYQEEIDRSTHRFNGDCEMIMTTMPDFVKLYNENNNIPLYDFSSLLRLATLRLERAGFRDSDFCKWSHSIDFVWEGENTNK
jgi:hypothetical protein